jgi:hypothetical protein
LIRVLARLDAGFVPCRDAFQQRVFYQHRRRVLLPFGLPWISGGSDSQRQAARRLLDAAQREGLIAVKPHGAGVAIRLTDLAEDKARSICGLPPISDGWASLKEVVRLSQAHDRQHVPEFVLCEWPAPRGIEKGSDDEAELRLGEDMMLPALCRGLVDSISTVSRHVAFFATPEGMAALDRGEEPPDHYDERAYRPDARALYFREFHAERVRLLAMKPTDRNIDPIPLDPRALTWPPAKEEAARD